MVLSIYVEQFIFFFLRKYILCWDLERTVIKVHWSAHDSLLYHGQAEAGGYIYSSSELSWFFEVLSCYLSLILQNGIGVRDQFRLGGGGGAEVSCPNILSIACPKIKWFCPNITWFFFLPEYGYLKNSRGGGAAAPSPRLLRLCKMGYTKT